MNQGEAYLWKQRAQVGADRIAESILSNARERVTAHLTDTRAAERGYWK